MEIERKDDCIFCQIANHVIESNYVYEDELVCAFRDMSPLAPTHVLVVPKAHYESLADDVPASTLAALLKAARAVGEADGVGESGFRVVANAGSDAGQVVHHLHLHVLGGRRLTDELA